MMLLLILTVLNATDSFNFKTKIAGQTAANNNNNDNIARREDIEIMVPLK